MKLIICEKPSLAKNVANSISIKIKRNEGYYTVNDYIVSWVFGHLFELKDVKDYLYQDKVKWSEIPLPFIPKKFEFKIKNDPGAKSQFKILKKILVEYNIEEIIHCGDADREGQIIIDTIINQLKYKGKVTRLWLPEQTPETVIKQLEKREDNKNYINLSNEGYARMYLDWILGINYTIYSTVKKGDLFKVGRVLLPIIEQINKIETNIKNFKPQKYYQLVSEEKNIKLELKEKFDLEDRSALENKKNELNNSEALIIGIKEEKIRKQPKKLFSLSKLQSELSKAHKINFESSLKIIQGLYEKQLITYPRTNTEYLANNEVEKVQEIIKNYPGLNLKVKDSKKIFDDSKIESHSAIIITNKKVVEGDLNKYEDIVYSTIFNRFISNFLAEETLVSKTTLKVDVGGEIFKLKGEVIIQEGFLKYEPQNFQNNLPQLKEGDKFKVNFSEIEKETTPPKKVSESSLATFLKNPFKTEKTTEEEEYKAIFEGIEIGTEATRTGIISKCIKEGYISMNSQSFSIEEKGRILIDTLKKLEIDLFKERNVEFSKKLKLIYKNELTLEALISDITKEIKETVSKNVEVDKVEATIEIIGSCPKCGKNVYEKKTKAGKTFYYCEKCDFMLWSEAKYFKTDIKISKSQAKALLKKGGKAAIIVGKNKKILKIVINGKWVNFEEIR